MRKSTLLSAVFALLLFAAAPQAHAQTDISVGPRAGYDLNEFEALFVGADARIGVATLPIRINPTFDYYFVDSFAGTDVEEAGNADVSAYQITVNALYELGIENTTFTPYAGAGLSYIDGSISGEGDDDTTVTIGFESEIGLNILGGAEFTEVNGFVPFAQAEFVVGGDVNPFKITGGILFNVGS